ncbi:MAG: hypothetical protein IJ267_04255 [Bacteroidales bacterium]|nr:hypothetical protein [Bacteroidales bacterium]
MPSLAIELVALISPREIQIAIKVPRIPNEVHNPGREFSNCLDFVLLYVRINPMVKTPPITNTAALYSQPLVVPGNGESIDINALKSLLIGIV